MSHERGQVFPVAGFPFSDVSKPWADRSAGEGGPRGDSKAPAKTEEHSQALPEGIRRMTPEIQDFRRMKHRTPLPVYLPEGGSTRLAVEGRYTLQWFNPRDGTQGDTSSFNETLTAPDANDWLAVIRRN